MKTQQYSSGRAVGAGQLIIWLAGVKQYMTGAGETIPDVS